MLPRYSLLIGLIFCVFVGLWIVPCTEKDKQAYQELVKSSNPDSQDDILTYTQQTRGKVRKCVWYQDKTPLQIRIDGEESELFFFRQDKKMEIVEQLGNVVCMMQEELYYVSGKPMQKVRYMEAEKATYNYTTHQFIAEDVKIWKYQLSGHIPPEPKKYDHPMMSATAKTVEFSFKGEKLDFVAHRMKTIVDSKDRSL